MDTATTAAAVSEHLGWCRQELCATFAKCCDGKPKALFAEAVAKIDAARALLAAAKTDAVTGAIEECGEAVSALAGTCCHDLRPCVYQSVSDALSEAALASRR